MNNRQRNFWTQVWSIFYEYNQSDEALVSKAPKPVSFLAREILSNLRRFPHCLLLTRVGTFYEVERFSNMIVRFPDLSIKSYFDQALEISRLLNIKLTSRKWNGERVAMCGFPIQHLDRYLKVLVQQEHRFVAMCEEFAHYDSNGLKEFERRISRIITPGTLIDESFIDPCNNNYLLAVNVPLSSDPVGLAWIDVATGEFFSKNCAFENLKDELARLAPREIVLDESMKQYKEHPTLVVLSEVNCVISYCSPAAPLFSGALEPSHAQVTFKEPTPLEKGSDPKLNLRDQTLGPDRETLAIKLLTDFLQANLREHMPLLNAPRHEDIQDRMQIDAQTIQGLEIREVGHEGITKGSLLSVVKRTLTSGGSRLLSRWLCGSLSRLNADFLIFPLGSPSTSLVEINQRQSLVSFFHRRQHFRADICGILKEMDDVTRLCQRFLLGRADFSDVIGIKTAIGTWDTLKRNCENEKLLEGAENRLPPYSSEWASVESLLHRMNNIGDLYDKISQAVIVNCDSTELWLGESTMMENEDSNNEISNAAKSKKWSINPRHAVSSYNFVV